MLFAALLGLVAINGASASPMPQGPNTIAQYNPTLRTMSSNSSWAILPLDRDIVAAIVAPKKLIPVTGDSSRFPNGWPANTHPVLITGGFNTFIEQLGLEIPNSLSQGALTVPNVDQLGDGKTGFRLDIAGFIGGPNGQALPGAVPALVGSAEGNTLREGDFQPSDKAVTDIGGGEFTFQVDNLIVPNPVSGPAVAPNVFSFRYHKVSKSKLATAKGFRGFINQPAILNNGLCGRSPYYFNETFTRPFFAEGQTILYSFGGLTGIPDSVAGTYSNASFFSGNAETVGYNPQDCASAAADTDPASVN